MRIPSSAIVMTLVAAVPFGLAIRDTLHGDARAESRTEARERAEREHAEAREVERAQEAQYQMDRAAAEVERARHREDSARALVGDDFVTPGKAFAGIALGDRADYDRAAAAAVDYDVDAAGNYLRVSKLDVYADTGCDALAAIVARTWGEPVHDRVWLDYKTHHRASIRWQECGLELARFLEPADWVARLPLKSTGGSIDALVKQYGPDRAAVDLVDAGLDGNTLTSIHVITGDDHPDRVIGIQLTTTATRTAWQQVIAAMTKRLGAKPTSDPNLPDTVVRWSSPVPILLSIDSDQLELDIGAVGAVH